MAVVLHYGDAALTRRALESLCQQRFAGELVVVCADNGSLSRSALCDEAEGKGYAYLRFERNLGFAEGMNRAVASALERYPCDWLLLLNNDAVAEPAALQHLVQAAHETGAALVGPKILQLGPAGAETSPPVIWAAGGELSRWRYFGRNRGAGEPDRGQHSRREEHPFLSGCALLVRRDAFEQLQGFETAFFMYQEDIDLCLRAARLGHRLVYEPQARVWHAGSATAGDELGPLQSYYRWRNRLLLVDRQATGWGRAFFWWLWFPALALRDGLRYLLRGRAASLALLVSGLLDFFVARRRRTATAGLPGRVWAPSLEPTATTSHRRPTPGGEVDVEIRGGARERFEPVRE